tara:strand:+ start:2442 stop:3404 length:963 start_codon:yes stop_codon:yes gene_type:complete
MDYPQKKVNEMKLKVVGVLAYDSIISEFGKRDNLFGGSATHFAISASYLNQNVHITGAIGNDFDDKDLNTLSSIGINTDGIKKLNESTFRWEGKYEYDSPNDAITITNSIIKGDDNVLNTYKPQLFSQDEDEDEEYFLFLANGDPEHQLSLINQAENKSKFIGLDTMDFWINNKPDHVIKLFPLIDILIINENEAKLICNDNNLKKCISKLNSLGVKRMIIKLGNYGMIYSHDNETFFLPALLLDKVVDPTGAGDSFAGGFMGYLSTVQKSGEIEFKNACVFGTVMASFCVEDFGANKTLNLTEEEINIRKNLLFNQIKI